MKMKNETYDFLKKVALYFLPALATLIMTLGTIWGWDYSEPVALSVTALDTCLGTCLGISTANYYAKDDE